MAHANLQEVPSLFGEVTTYHDLSGKIESAIQQVEYFLRVGDMKTAWKEYDFAKSMAERIDPRVRFPKFPNV